jgi:mannose-6-phosphate isomerase-like protein (cupin superfamily)
MYVIVNRDQPATHLPGIEHRTLAGGDQGLARLSVWEQIVAPGAETPPHQHDCEEVVVVSEGYGELRIGGEALRYGPGSTLAIPPNVVHQIVNVGATPLKLLAALSTTNVEVYLPNGEPFPLPWQT